MSKDKLIRCHLFLLSVCLTFSILCGSNSVGADAARPSFQQVAGKVVEKDDVSFPGDPLRILSVEAAGRPIKFNEKFEAGEGWLKGLKLRVKNVSDKEIKFIHYDFDFPETTGTGNIMAYQLIIGHWPGIDNRLRTPLSLLPGGELDITLDEKRYADIARFINTRQSFTSISRVRLSFSFLIFADNTGYGVGGTAFRQDPNNPRRFLPAN